MTQLSTLDAAGGAPQGHKVDVTRGGRDWPRVIGTARRLGLAPGAVAYAAVGAAAVGATYVGAPAPVYAPGPATYVGAPGPAYAPAPAVAAAAPYGAPGYGYGPGPYPDAV